MSHEAEAQSRARRKTSPSMEQYIETIAHLLTQDKVTNISDIAAACCVSRPAASRSVRELAEKELVEHRAYGYVSLTKKGQALARRLQARHAEIRRFLEGILHLDSAYADLEACRLEHLLEDTVVERIRALTDFLDENPSVAKRWEKALSTRIPSD